MLENSTQGLTLLDAARIVVVTGVEHHQPALAAWTPLADGRPRQVAVELCCAPVTHGPDAGHRGIDVLLDGRPVGRLSSTVAERYAHHLDDLAAGGIRPAAVGIVARGPHGLEMELQLPDLAVTTEATTALSHVAPARPRPGPAPRSRRPYLIGAGVLALLLVVGMAVGGGSGGGDEPSVASAPTVAPRTSAPEITLPVPTATPAPTAALREAADPARTRPPRSREQSPRTAAAVEAPVQQADAPADSPEPAAPSTTPSSAPTRDRGGLLGGGDDDPETAGCPDGSTAGAVGCTPA